MAAEIEAFSDERLSAEADDCVARMAEGDDGARGWYDQILAEIERRLTAPQLRDRA